MKFLKLSKSLAEKKFLNDKEVIDRQILYSTNIFYADYICIFHKNLDFSNYIFFKKNFFQKAIQDQFALTIFEKKNYFFYKFINMIMLDGKKNLAFKNFKNVFLTIFSFFEIYNEELEQNYDLYKVYYEYSIEQKTSFFDPVFFFKTLSKLLEPTFILNKSKKTNKNKEQEIIIDYVPSFKRTSLFLKSIIIFAKSFDFKNFYMNIAYSVLNNFLTLKNSFLYKRKLLTYSRLLKTKKSL